MDYTRIKIFSKQDELEIISSLLVEKGINSVEIQEPQTFYEFLNKKNSFDWDYYDASLDELIGLPPAIVFYLEDNPEGIETLDEILQDVCIYYVERIEISGVSDDDWKNKWKQYFKTAEITDKFVVKPSWESYANTSGKLVINIDPGMAFGTGTHPTTVLCVKLLEKYIDDMKSSVLDIGCGSGVLTIAAALLGAKQIMAVDIDPIALDAAKRNIDINSLSADIRVVQGNLLNDCTCFADIIVANLMADLVIELSGEASKHLKPEGILIVSGIIIEKRNEVELALRESGFSILEVLTQEDWCAVSAAKAEGEK